MSKINSRLLISDNRPLHRVINVAKLPIFYIN